MTEEPTNEAGEETLDPHDWASMRALGHRAPGLDDAERAQADARPAAGPTAAARHARPRPCAERPLPPRHHETGAPSGRPPATRHADRLLIQATLHEEPGDDRVRAPHLAGSERVAPPHGRRRLRRQTKQSPSATLVLARALRVSTASPRSGMPQSLRHVYHKRREIEVEGAPACEQGRHGLEDLTVESHRATSGTGAWRRGASLQAEAPARRAKHSGRAGAWSARSTSPTRRGAPLRDP